MSPCPSGAIRCWRMSDSASGVARSILSSPMRNGEFSPNSWTSCAQAAPSPGARRSASAVVSSRATPRFELPSLGGSEILRGFRADDGLGRKLWTLQNEVWIPLNIGNDRSTGFKAMLRDKVKVATFVDVGGLYDAINVSSGIRAGTGAGLRFIYNPIIFKLDFGYGFGEKATTGGRGKFHFSISSNLPF